MHLYVLKVLGGRLYHLLRNQSLSTIRLDTLRQDEPDRFEAVKEDEPLRVIQDPYLGKQLYLMREVVWSGLVMYQKI